MYLFKGAVDKLRFAQYVLQEFESVNAKIFVFVIEKNGDSIVINLLLYSVGKNKN